MGGTDACAVAGRPDAPPSRTRPLIAVAMKPSDVPQLVGAFTPATARCGLALAGLGGGSLACPHRVGAHGALGYHAPRCVCVVSSPLRPYSRPGAKNSKRKEEEAAFGEAQAETPRRKLTRAPFTAGVTEQLELNRLLAEEHERRHAKHLMRRLRQHASDALHIKFEVSDGVGPRRSSVDDGHRNP